MKVLSCTTSSALAQAVVVHTAGWTVFLDVFKDAGLLSLPYVTASVEAGDGPQVEFDWPITRVLRLIKQKNSSFLQNGVPNPIK